MRKGLPLLVGASIVLVGLSGCLDAGELGPDDPLVLAFTLKDDHVNTDKDPQRLAAFLSERMGRPVTLYDVHHEGAATQALRFGHAHAAFFDGGAAWLAWQLYGIEAVAADQHADGRTFYVAQAWVRNDSDIQTLEQLQGRDSCHTGWLKSAGMLMPMGYLIRTGIAPVVGDPEDILSLQATIDHFFGTAHVPGAQSIYYNYHGALRCLTEGVGDVAFVKDTSYEDHCQGRDFCQDRGFYRKLEPAFGAVPSHPVMVSPKLSDAVRQQFVAALLALNDSAEGQSILQSVLETPGITAVTTEEHLGDYSQNLRHVPGLRQVYQEKFEMPSE